MTIFTDNFAGTNGDNVSARSGWNKYGSGTTDVAQVNASGQLKIAGTFPDDGAMYGQDPGNVAHFVEAKLLANCIVSKVNPCLCVRVTDRTDYLSVFYDDGSSVWRIRSTGGAGSLDSWSMAAPSGETYQVQISAAHVVTVYKNGSLVRTHDCTGELTTAQNTATKVGGFFCATSSSPVDNVLDDWRSGLVSDLSGSTPAIGPLMYYQRLLRGG